MFFKLKLFVHHVEEIHILFEFFHFFNKKFQSFNYIKLRKDFTQDPYTVKVSFINE